jgi:signal transduction histidine kinase
MLHDALSTSRPAGGRLTLERAGWLALCICLLALFALGQWFLYFELQQPCEPPRCVDDMFYLTRAEIQSMQARGYSASLYAGYNVGLYVVFFLVHATLATLIFWNRPEDRMAKFTAFALLFWSATFPSTPLVLWRIMPFAAWLLTVGAAIGGLCFYLFLFLFPSGRFAPRSMRWIMLVLGAYSVASTLTFNAGASTPFAAWIHTFQIPMFILFLSSAIGTQIYRYLRISTTAERVQTRWVFLGIVAGLGCISALVLSSFLFPGLQHGAGNKMVLTTLIYVGFLVVPVSIAVAILRARLWDIDLLINRALVYGALTASIVALYVLVVGYLSTLFQTSGNLLISLIATGLVAVLFQPLRARLQRGVNRLIYGEREDPYTALARLGQQLEGTLAPDSVLPTIVQSVRHTLKLPYVAIALDQDGHCVAAAAAGVPVADPLSMPLVYQGETLGQLVLGPRAAGNAFGAADRRLLDDLARQIGVAAHAVRLTADLQRARERLVATREEERRRIRRDLHDGLGPQLASQTLTIDAVLRLLPDDTDAALGLLRQLKTNSQSAIADIRRLVYALRPPALDELGLLGAIRSLAQDSLGFWVVEGTPSDGPGLPARAEHSRTLVLAAPQNMPSLPAAVEVAVYRIVQEALTNVVKHAGARTVTLAITIDDGVHISVEDDGRGLPPDRRAGVGLSSMEERAAELGGHLTIAALPAGGTRVAADLPLASFGVDVTA